MSPRSRLARRSAIAAVASLTLIGLAAGPALADAPVSQATAQAVNLAAFGVADVADSAVPTQSTNDGTGSDAPTTNAPNATTLGTQSFIGAGVLQETTEAAAAGSSFGCSGVLSPGSSVQVGSTGTSCTVAGNGTGGVTLDLKAVPTLGSATAPFGQLKITIDSVLSHADLDTAGNATRGATIAHVTITGCLQGAAAGSCLNPPVTQDVTIVGTPNEDLLAAALSALGGANGLSSAVSTLTTTLSPLLTLVANYQPAITNGVASVSGIHATLVNTPGAVADLAKVTVGPNASAAPAPVVSSQSLPIVIAVLIALAVVAVLVRRSRLGRQPAA